MGKAFLRDAIVEIQAAFEEGNQGLEKVADILKKPRLAVQLSFHKIGCRLIQKALDVFMTKDAVDLALQFKGSVWQASWHKHANYVIQKMIGVLCQSKIDFIVQELWCYELACSEYGCRMFVQLLRSHAKAPAVLSLIDSLLANTLHLATHVFAHHTLEEVLEHGADYQRRGVIDMLLPNWQMLLQDKSGVYVLVKVLGYGERKDVAFLAPHLVKLASDKVFTASKAGGMVMRALMKHKECGEVASLIRSCVCSSRPLRRRS